MTCTISRLHAIAAAFALGAFLTAAVSADVVGWRTDGTSRYPEATPPTAWSDSHNVIWKTKTPQWSNATPVVTGDRIFITAEPDLLVCVNAADGNILWQKTCAIDPTDPGKVEAAKVAQDQKNDLQRQYRRARGDLNKDKDNADLKAKVAEIQRQMKDVEAELARLDKFRPPQTHNANGYASATPVTDGKHVYALFGSGVAAAFDYAGKQQWIRFLEVPKRDWGNSASPAISGDTLVVAINEVFGLDLATGKTKWQAGAGHGWGSPVPVTIGGVDAIIMPTGRIFRSDNGDALPGNLGQLVYNAPLVQDGVVYFIDGQKTTAAWKLPAQLGDEPTKLWESQLTRERYYASPLLHEGIIYAIDQKAVFTALDAATGEQIFQKKVDDLGKATVYPSICLAGDVLFVSSEGGATVIVKPGRTYQQIASNNLEPFRSTPVFVGTRMYIRGRNHLYCIAQNKLTRADR